MAKIIQKGIIKEVTPIISVGTNNTKKQTLILFVPGYVDQFGDKKGRDEEWPIDLIGDNIGKFNLSANVVNQKATCTLYVSGTSYVNKDGQIAYFISANLAAIELHGAAAPIQQTTPVQMPVSTAVDLSAKPNDDDLPF